MRAYVLFAKPVRSVNILGLFLLVGTDSWPGRVETTLKPVWSHEIPRELEGEALVVQKNSNEKKGTLFRRDPGVLLPQGGSCHPHIRSERFQGARNFLSISLLMRGLHTLAKTENL